MWPFDREVPGDAHAAFDHKTIYAQLQNGNGPSGLSDAVSAWQSRIGSQFDEAHQLITSGLTKASAVWEGAAADAMQGDVAPMARFVLDAKDVSHSVGQSTQSQADHFADVKHKMPPPVEVTATDSWLSRGWAHLTGGQTDAEAQEQQALQASDQAAAVYSDYRNNTSTASTAMSSYPTVPQSNGIDAAPPQQTGTPVPYQGGDYQSGPYSGPYSRHVGTPPGSAVHPPSGPPGGQQPPVGGPPIDVQPPTEIQHYPPVTVNPPHLPPFPGPPPGQPPVGAPPEPIPFPGPPGSSGGDGVGGGGRGGASSGFGGRTGASTGSGGNALGRGGSAGAGALEEGGPGARSATGAAGKPGVNSGQGMPGAAGRGKNKGEEDQEHLNKFMEPTDEHWGTGEKTVPPVIGDPGYQP